MKIFGLGRYWFVAEKDWIFQFIDLCEVLWQYFCFIVPLDLGIVHFLFLCAPLCEVYQFWMKTSGVSLQTDFCPMNYHGPVPLIKEGDDRDMYENHSWGFLILCVYHKLCVQGGLDMYECSAGIPFLTSALCCNSTEQLSETNNKNIEILMIFVTWRVSLVWFF